MGRLEGKVAIITGAGMGNKILNPTANPDGLCFKAGTFPGIR